MLKGMGGPPLQRWGTSWAVAVLALMPAAAPGVHLRGRILHVGFPGSGAGEYDRGGHHYRVGTWTPILIELTNDDGDRFEGTIEARQADRDGDEVAARRDVVVQDVRRCFLYVPGGRYERSGQFNVQVFAADGQFAPLYDDGGEKLRELRLPGEVMPLPAEARVILDVSARPIGQLRKLVMDEQLLRELFVARSSPSDLPDEVAGLDLADVIVWDAADPGAIDLPQRNALLEWTRQGGTLVLGVSRNWDRISKSKLMPILPARLAGTATMAQPPEWAAELLGIDVFDTNRGRLDPPLTYCPVTHRDLAPDATALVPDPHRDLSEGGSQVPAQDHLLVTQRPCGRGKVILVAAELGDLLKHGRRNLALLRELLGIRRKPTRDRDAGGMVFDTDLFGDYVQQKTAFGVTAGLYLFFACIFVVGYMAVATAGSWAWLRRKGLTQHAWTGFALVAVAASVVSVVAVQWIRGIRYRVQELSIVDTRAGSDEAVATSYFGLKAPAHSRLDLRVPRNWLAPDDPGDPPCLLGPQPADPRRFSTYSATERYEAVAGLGELRAVPLRATLKQFEAHWRGQLAGQLNASLRRVRAGSIEMSDPSWIENNLGTDLRDCYVFVAARDIEPNRAYRVSIEVCRIGDLGNGHRVTWRQLLERQTIKADAAQASSQGRGQSKVGRKLLPDFQREWLRGLGVRSRHAYRDESQRMRITQENFVSALLLLTLYEEIDPDGILRDGYELLRSHGQRLDRSDHLTRDTALFVGFSREPGPSRLCYRTAGQAGRRWKPIQPSQADVVYRVAIPIEEP